MGIPCSNSEDSLQCRVLDIWQFSTESHHTGTTVCSNATYICSVWSPFTIFFVVLWFESRALQVLGRCSTTWVTPTALLCVQYFWDRFLQMIYSGLSYFPRHWLQTTILLISAFKKIGFQVWVTGAEHHFLSWSDMVMALCTISLVLYRHHVKTPRINNQRFSYCSGHSEFYLLCSRTWDQEQHK
jgi:hypothetical protein